MQPGKQPSVEKLAQTYNMFFSLKAAAQLVHMWSKKLKKGGASNGTYQTRGTFCSGRCPKGRKSGGGLQRRNDRQETRQESASRSPHSTVRLTDLVTNPM